ncbi:MAG: radical SAM protein, partial [Muricomes sp.]|nr:radical SAM protein [Muricomes sp.]
MSNSIKDSAQAFAVNQVLKYVDSNPQEAFPKLLDWADKFDKDNLYLTQRQQIRKVMEQPDSNWMRLINSLWTDIDSEVRKVFFRNFIVNASLLGSRKQVANREKYGCNIPWAILMDPTSACNLHCTGCWAAEYGNKLNLSYEELDDIINQANELGTYMFLYTGGEPMVRKNDLLRLCEAHPDCVFSAFTNGTLIDEKFADEMLRVKNFYPAISIEGFEEATDFRRGKGTYQATMRAMKILKEKKLPFGVSGCYT